MHLPNHCFKREKKAHFLLNPDNISIKEELSKEIYASVNFYDTASTFKNKLNVDDNITDDVFNIDDKLIKTKDYTKMDKIKNDYVTEISEIPINKKYDHDFTRNRN